MSESRVYKNLNNGLWSIKQRVNGKWTVVGHCESCAINNVDVFISDKRHDYVRNGNHREVFAWLIGELCEVKGFMPYKGREALTADAYPLRPFNRTRPITFRPFADEKRGFIYTDDNSDYRGSSCAFFTANSGVWAV